MSNHICNACLRQLGPMETLDKERGATCGTCGHRGLNSGIGEKTAENLEHVRVWADAKRKQLAAAGPQ